MSATGTSRLTKSPWRKWYASQAWRRRAKGQLELEPRCVICLKEGHLTRATVADHVEPHRGDPQKFWHGPLQSLCVRHHLQKLNHEAQERRTGKPYRPPYRPRSGCDESGLPTDPEHPWHAKK